MGAIRRWWERAAAVHPAVWALRVVAAVTWMVAVTLFVAMIRNVDQQIDREALDGTALTLLSGMIATWAGFGVWAGRHSARWQFLRIALAALGGIALITGFAMLYMAFAGEPFAIPSNVAQLLILTTTALVSIAGTSVGYNSQAGGFPDDVPAQMDPPEDEPPPE